MPLKNHFRHQSYHADEPTAPWSFTEAAFPAQPGSDSFAASLSRFSDAAQANVDALWFVHGTFAGHDALGWLAQLERVMPSTGPVMKTFGKRLTDLMAGDSGNYSAAFVNLVDTPVPGRRFVWSGENTHSGRCKAAVTLLDELLQRSADEPRVLLWGHSHAGNIAALISNLIGSETWVSESFLDLVEPLFPDHEDQAGIVSRVRSAIKSGAAAELKIDVVNFGTPVCYGWDPAGYRKLLHVVNHAPQPKTPRWLCSPAEALKRREVPQGDFVQVLAITGSDFWPWLLTRNSRDSETKLQQFLASDYSRRNWWSRAKIGVRVAEEGETMLIRYESRDGHETETFGHSIYTRPQWLSFHLDLVAGFYDSFSASDLS